MNERLNVASCALALAILAVCAIPIMAQENSGKILGTVTDDSGASVPEAKITAAGPTVPRGLETFSDSTGRYQFQSVPIGLYTVTVEKQGFNTVRQRDIQVK